jgi:N6-L-threonylcarbamoyladenine synthase
MQNGRMSILAIESSCDETAVAIFDERHGLRAHRLHSQVALHAEYGGVVPELASRDHLARIIPLLAETLDDAGLRARDLSGVAYTAGPGLIGALMVGGATALGLAQALGCGVIPIHHMEGHLLAPMLEPQPPTFPFVALLVSGGHTLLVAVAGLGRYRVLGQSLDDAVGEAFDKTAKLLGLPYPGGPHLAELAEQGDPAAYRFPRPMTDRPGLDFSFSGLKTAVALRVPEVAGDRGRADLAASFQQAVTDTLCLKCARAIEATGFGTLVVAGGVGANRQLRAQLDAWAHTAGIRVAFPRQAFCTDNAAMIAYAGWQRRAEARAPEQGLWATPRWSLDELAPPCMT